MWRGGAFPFGSARDGVDSDQSISEEDDEGLEGDDRGSTVSLGATADKSAGMQVLSQLEILRDSSKHSTHEKEHFSSHERNSGCFSDDEVENPLFDDDEDGSIRPSRCGSASHSLQGIMHLPMMASNSHHDEEIISDEEESCSPILGSGAVAYSKTKKFGADLGLILLEKESEKPDSHVILSKVARKDNIKKNSAAESLDCLYDDFAPRRGNPEMDILKRGREAYALSLGDGRILDDDDELPQAFDGKLADSSGEDNRFVQENPPQHPKLAIPTRTMADQFCEAFGTVSAHGVRSHLTIQGPYCSSSSATYGKLQSLIQAEKERDVDYLKHTSAGTCCSMDERNSKKVRIMSMRLEAKLVACSCSVIGDRKLLPYLENDSETKSRGLAGSVTVLFNPRICSNVELEVDNVICIHSPWKEVQVNGKDDEVVLLSSYYCRNSH